MPQAMTGKQKSTAKLVRVNAADGEAVLFRNLGNGRRLPFIWGTTVTLASGTSEVIVSSGVKYNDHKAADAVIMVTPLTDAGAAMNYYIDKDSVNNIVKLKGGSASQDLEFDIMFMLGIGYNFTHAAHTQIWKYE